MKRNMNKVAQILHIENLRILSITNTKSNGNIMANNGCHTFHACRALGAKVIKNPEYLTKIVYKSKISV